MRHRHLAPIALTLALALAACTAQAVHPAVTRVAELLELRRSDVREPAAYEVFFEDPSLASALAQGSGEPTGTPQVPEYDPPYLSAETSATADVAVVWKMSDDFPDWPAVTVFILSLVDGDWMVTDALEATSAPEPLAATAE